MRSLAWDQRRTWEGCGTGSEPDGLSSISMAPDRRPDNVLCLRGLICHHHSGVCRQCVAPPKPFVIVGKVGAPVQQFCGSVRIKCLSPANLMALDIERERLLRVA